MNPIPDQKKGSRSILIPATIGLLLVVGGGFLYSHSHKDTAEEAETNKPVPDSVPVTAKPAEKRDLPIHLTGIGSVQPLNVVNVKSQIDGPLQRVDFIEGQNVHAGDLLAQIDPRPFEVQLKQAQAIRAKDAAQLASAGIDLTRYTKLSSLGAAPSQNVDTFKAQVAALNASIMADEAAIETAQLQLGYTTIVSPIDGRVGLRQVDPGTLVHASDANGIVTVTQMKPIAVIFTLSQDRLPDVLAVAGHKAAVTVSTRDGTRTLAKGELLVVDSQVDPSSGQVKLKAVFDNEDGLLWPGEFISARLLIRSEYGAVVVPSSAIQRGQKGTYVYVVKPDQTAELRPVEIGAVVDGMSAVTKNLSHGETVVLDGQSRLSPGSKVDVMGATMDITTR